MWQNHAIMYPQFHHPRHDDVLDKKEGQECYEAQYKCRDENNIETHREGAEQ